MLLNIPLFILLLISYNVVMFTGNIDAFHAKQFFDANLVSGAHWNLTGQDLFIISGVVVLYLELIKATRTGVATILDHTFSMLVFVIFLIEFLLIANCGTSTFFVLMMMSLLDVISGFTISIAAARRDFAIGN